MKKSNIILTGIFSIILIAIIIMQFKFKSYLNHYEINKVDLAFSSFNSIEINNGWYVELHKDSLIKVTINSDSVNNLISLNNDKLTLSKTDKNSDHKLKVQILAPNVNQISLSGNSILYYYASHIDSLNVNLSDNSNLVIKGAEDKGHKVQSQGKIHFLNINVTNSSRIYIYGEVKELQGQLQDSSYCRLPTKAHLKDFIKSENANINSW